MNARSGKDRCGTIGITLGDPAGVGPELVRQAVRRLGSKYKLRVLGDKGKVVAGKPTRRGAEMALCALKESVALLHRGEIQAVVNAPVSKEWLARVGFTFPGQTEFYANSFGKKPGEVTMVMIGPRLRVALASTHLPLIEAVRQLNQHSIFRAGRHLQEILRRLGVKKPKIAVCGLNPHAGEGGLFGREETKIVRPAISRLCRSAGGDFVGPESPDTVFRRAAEGEFDGVVALYHDQALIPAKLLDFATTVNLTAGLPIVRCSPDHGTAFSLAGKGKANVESLLAAIRLAGQLLQAGPKE